MEHTCATCMRSTACCECPMKITAIECIPVDVPLVPEFQIRGSLGSHLKSPFLLVRMHTDEGLEGLGEVSCTPLWSGEDQVTAAHLIANFLAPALTGEDPPRHRTAYGKDPPHRGRQSVYEIGARDGAVGH